MLGGLKRMLRSWLEIQEAPGTSIRIEEKFDFNANAIKNEIWMRGDPLEIEQFYKNVYNGEAMFWASTPHIKLRKIHTGLPSIIVDTLSSIVVRDMNDITLSSRQDEFEVISDENNLKDLIDEAISKALSIGDGAFKISFDKSISNLPIIEFYDSKKVEFKYQRGRFKEAIFSTDYSHNNKNYVLYENYGFGYVKYKLKTADTDKEVQLNSIPQTAKLVDVSFGGYLEDAEGNVVQKGSYCMAIPFMILKSTKWKGRGRSIFDLKTGAFDAFDEVFSQWMDALRAGRATKYIPASLVPRNPDTGKLYKPNDFDNRFIVSGDDMKENGKNEIKVTQPVIPSENYLETYISSLDLCLQGLISPSTLGIDVKKMDNAEAQREKEKTTLYTRNKIIEALQSCLPLLVNNVLKAKDTDSGKLSDEDIEVTIEFGEYSNPSFEAQVETVAKAKAGGIMSIETTVDELYGDSKEDDWKAKEVIRLKSEQGITEMEEPMIANVEDVEPTTESTMTNLNGAQITSMMGIIKSVKTGELSRANAISIITSTLGVSREAAETFIDEQDITIGGTK